jgi:2-oxoglutarate dehydrogenase complex dehydrogenase (E1) component-like enzyme
MVTNNLFGMGTAIDRHSAVTDLKQKGESFGVPGMECDGMDVLDTYAVTQEALRIAREERQPILVEAETYRFRGHSMADPEEYRSKEQVEEWRKRDPIQTFARRIVDAGVLTDEDVERLDEETVARVDEAVAFADRSPHPEPESLYDDIYVLGGQLRGWYSVDERSSEVHKGEDERERGRGAGTAQPQYDAAVKESENEDVVRENPAQDDTDRARHMPETGAAPEGAS